MPIRPGIRILTYGRTGRSPLSLRAGNTIAFGELLRRSPIVWADRLGPVIPSYGAFETSFGMTFAGARRAEVSRKERFVTDKRGPSVRHRSVLLKQAGSGNRPNNRRWVMCLGTVERAGLTTCYAENPSSGELKS